MACFLVPAAEAVVVKAIEKKAEKKEAAQETAPLQNGGTGEMVESGTRIPMSRKLKLLCRLLVGGVVLLVFEHIWHGEIQPFFPFFTALEDPGSTAEMFHEMATTGVAMSVTVTAVWAVMCRVIDRIAARAPEADSKAELK